MPQLVSVLEVHDLVHHGMPVMQVAGAVQSELERHESPVGFVVTPPSDPAMGAQYDGFGAEEDTGLQVVFWYCEQSAFVEQLGTHALPPVVWMHRFGWPTLFAPHPALDTHGCVHQVPWQVLPVGQSAMEAQGSPTCEPPAPLEPLEPPELCASAPLLLDAPLLPPPLPLLEVVPSSPPPLDPSSDVMLGPTA